MHMFVLGYCYVFGVCALMIGMELQNEVGWLSKIQHQNIVSLLGYCIHEQSRFLVYEIMQNGSLECQLHGKGVLHLY